jgi:hypothetical protein
MNEGDDMITGKLTNVGTMQVGHETDRTGYFIEASASSIRSIVVLPMYEKVAVLDVREIEAMRSERDQMARDRDTAMEAQSETREKLNAALLECARLRDVLRTYNITVPETKPLRGPQHCSHCGATVGSPESVQILQQLNRTNQPPSARNSTPPSDTFLTPSKLCPSPPRLT